MRSNNRVSIQTGLYHYFIITTFTSLPDLNHVLCFLIVAHPGDHVDQSTMLYAHVMSLLPDANSQKSFITFSFFPMITITDLRFSQLYAIIASEVSINTILIFMDSVTDIKSSINTVNKQKNK